MSRKYAQIEALKDIVELPGRYVKMDFYIDIANDGKRRDLILSYRRGQYVPFENLEYLQRRIDDDRIYIRGDQTKRKLDFPMSDYEEEPSTKGISQP